MAIQTLILGAPITGAGGDKYRDAHNKINANFVYVDSRIAEAETDATTKADAAQSAAISTAATDATTKDAVVLSSAKAHADNVGSSALTSSKAYTDTTALYNDMNDTSVSSTTCYTDAGVKIAHAFVDEDSKVGVSIDTERNINAGNISSGTNLPSDIILSDANGAAVLHTDKDGAVITNGVKFKQFSSAFPFALLGADNKALLLFNKNGELHNPAFSSLKNAVSVLSKDLELANKEIVNLKNNSELLDLGAHKADISHIITYGQSLARGARALPLISTTQPHQNIMFDSGMLARPMDADWSGESFVPMVETTLRELGETPTSSMLNTFVDYRVADGQSANDWVLLGSAPGEGGQTIQALSKGEQYYTGLISQVQTAYELAQDAGKSYAVWCVTWTQGEANYVNPVTKNEYIQLFDTLRDDLNTDINAITNQAFNTPIIMYQTASQMHSAAHTMQIALAQLDIVDKHPDVFMSTPIYHLPHAFDHLHLTADSSYQLGKYYAKTLNAIYNGEQWEPLRPTNILKQGRVILISFNKDNLAIDTDEVTPADNYGFDIRDANDNVRKIIQNVSVSNNQVRIVCSSEPPIGSKIVYARGRDSYPRASGPVDGARGNLRDNAGDDDNYIDSAGNVRYMHNWCVMFEQSI